MEGNVHEVVIAGGTYIWPASIIARSPRSLAPSREQWSGPRFFGLAAGQGLPMAKPKGTRCAVYTRKSSEEGLDQSFNSLHAQREACEAYIISQRHEGWSLIPTPYDDGGFLVAPWSVRLSRLFWPT